MGRIAGSCPQHAGAVQSRGVHAPRQMAAERSVKPSGRRQCRIRWHLRAATMRNRERSVLIAAVVAGACAPPVTVSRKDASVVRGPLGVAANEYLNGAADSGFDGTVPIAPGNDLILHRGYGFADRERTVRVTTETPFWIASSRTALPVVAPPRISGGRDPPGHPHHRSYRRTRAGERARE
jgi:hypothetical protein